MTEFLFWESCVKMYTVFDFQIINFRMFQKKISYLSLKLFYFVKTNIFNASHLEMV